MFYCLKFKQIDKITPNVSICHLVCTDGAFNILKLVVVFLQCFKSLICVPGPHLHPLFHALCLHFAAPADTTPFTQGMGKGTREP